MSRTAEGFATLARPPGRELAEFTRKTRPGRLCPPCRPRHRRRRRTTTVTAAIGLTMAAALVAIGTSRAPAWAQETPAQSTSVEAPFLAENDTAMAKMMADMAVMPSGDVDRDFVAMMVPHHQGAIDMAQALLRYGHNEQLRRLAQEIIITQQQEIAAMRLALGEPLPPSVPAADQPSQPPHMTHMHKEP